MQCSAVQYDIVHCRTVWCTGHSTGYIRRDVPTEPTSALPVYIRKPRPAVLSVAPPFRYGHPSLKDVFPSNLSTFYTVDGDIFRWISRRPVCSSCCRLVPPVVLLPAVGGGDQTLLDNDNISHCQKSALRTVPTIASIAIDNIFHTTRSTLSDKVMFHRHYPGRGRDTPER